MELNTLDHLLCILPHDLKYILVTNFPELSKCSKYPKPGIVQPLGGPLYRILYIPSHDLEYLGQISLNRPNVPNALK